MKPKTKTVHFSVEGEFITDLVRRIWADELDPARALRILSSVNGLPLTDCYAICEGRKKLTGTDQICLEEDNATHSAAGNPLLDHEALMAKIAEKTRPRDPEELSDPELDEQIEQLREFTDESNKRLAISKQVHERLLKQGFMPIGANPALAGITDVLFNPAPAGKPKHDPKFESTSGWLSPDGKFYGCRYYEHVDLAGRLGFEEGNMEKRGWIKISDRKQAPIPRDYDIMENPLKRPTQAQLNALDKWAAKHGRELPPWLTKDIE